VLFSDSKSKEFTVNTGLLCNVTRRDNVIAGVFVSQDTLVVDLYYTKVRIIRNDATD